jgi:hypothetical protein
MMPDLVALLVQYHSTDTGTGGALGITCVLVAGASAYRGHCALRRTAPYCP